MRRGRGRKNSYVLGDETTAEQVLQLIGSSYRLDEVGGEKRIEHYFDTFDWCLFKAGYLLKRQGSTLLLSDTKDQIIAKDAAGNRKCFFSWELNDGELRQVLTSIAKIRALMAVFCSSVERKKFHLCNRDEKTVLRLFLDDGQVNDDDIKARLPHIIHLEEVRGYEKAFARVTGLLKENGIKCMEEKYSFFSFALSEINRKPLDYSSKFTISLRRNQTVPDTVTAICAKLVNAMQRNYDGVVEDIDSEFLHDFRVAMRRIRSLFSQMKKQVPQESYIYFQQELRWLGSITGPVRDLDVYLLEEEHYRSMLPDSLHHGLNEFFIDLEGRRNKSLAMLYKGIGSERYLQLMDRWQGFIAQGANGWPVKDTICYPLVVKMIQKRFKKILKDGGQINDQSPDKSLHRLRIQGKKLRYMLEFFRSYFKGEDIDFFLTQLKKLQNNLGDFNDLSVQQEMLTTYKAELTGRSKRSIAIAAAIGGLISSLAIEHTKVRQKFESTFCHFADRQNSERFKSLFS